MCLSPEKGREQQQPCPQPSSALGSSPHPSLQTCAPRPGPQPELGSLLPVSQLPEANVFAPQLVMMSPMGHRGDVPNGTCGSGSRVSLVGLFSSSRGT